MEHQAPYVLIPKAAAMTGYSVEAIERKIQRGEWLDGHEYHRDQSGAVSIDMDGFTRWAEGRRITMPVAPKAVMVRRPIEPVATALYRHFDAAGVLLYVGVSLSPLARLSKHGDSSHWSKSIARVSMEWFADRPSALSAEARAIRIENPAHNIAGRRK